MISIQIPSKEEIILLPQFVGTLPENIFIPQTPTEFSDAVQDICGYLLIGFDTESKPTFQRGEKSEGPHLIQFSTVERTYLFQLHHHGALEAARIVLESECCVKIGFGLKSDRTDLKTNFNITARKLLDLAVHLRGKIKKDTVGARSAVAAILGTNLQKSHKQTTSNWANRQLTPAQINYAANDSLSALLVFLALKPEDQANLLRDL